MTAELEPPPPPPPRITAGVVPLAASIVGVAAFFPWRLEQCERYYDLDFVSCEYVSYPAPVHGIGVVTLIALVVVAVLGVIAVWRPTKGTWRACGWGALVTGVVAYASLGYDRQIAMLNATHPGMAAAGFDIAAGALAATGLAVMAMGRILPSERLPHARATGRV